MNVYYLKELAKYIVKDDKITKAQARKIVTLLTVQELKTLVKYVKLEEEKNTARVTSADELSKKEMNEISKIFGNKKVINSVDKKIGAGLSAQVYDMIYDLSLKSKVNSMVQNLEEEL